MVSLNTDYTVAGSACAENVRHAVGNMTKTPRPFSLTDSSTRYYCSDQWQVLEKRLDQAERTDHRNTGGWSSIGREAGGVGGLLLVGDHDAAEAHFVGNDSVNKWDYLGLADTIDCDSFIGSPEFKALPPHIKAAILLACMPPRVICPDGCGPAGPTHPDRPEPNIEIEIVEPEECCDDKPNCWLKSGREILPGAVEDQVSRKLIQAGDCACTVIRTASGIGNILIAQKYLECVRDCKQWSIRELLNYRCFD